MDRQGIRCVSWGDGILVDACRAHMRLKNDHPLNVMTAACDALERAPDRFRKFMMRGHDCNGRSRLVKGVRDANDSKMNVMDGNTQLRIAGILHSFLHDDDEFFDGDDAAFLYKILPPHDGRKFMRKATFEGPRFFNFLRGLTSTGHDVNLEDQDQSVKKVLYDDYPDKYWCGKFAVYRIGNTVIFEDRFIDTRMDEGAKDLSWMIQYHGGTPVCLLRAVSKIRRFGIPYILMFEYEYVDYTKWKRPVMVCNCG